VTAGPIVVDTMIAGAWLGRTHSQRKARWIPLLERVAWVLPFTVVAELRFGAEVAAWGARRRGVLERLIASTAVLPPIDAVTDAYVDLRTRCVRNGHPRSQGPRGRPVGGSRGDREPASTRDRGHHL